MKVEECCGNCYWNIVTKEGIVCLHPESEICGDAVNAKNLCHLFEIWPEQIEEGVQLCR